MGRGSFALIGEGVAGQKNNRKAYGGNHLQMLQRMQSGLFSYIDIHQRLNKNLKLLRRTLGHLSAVYCLLFDWTGTLVFTGADDLLVKCWNLADGRLLHTFRGASSEISDLAVSPDNKLLAAGSCDKIIRVWCLSTRAPLAVLSKHTGMITAINFCPYSECCDESGGAGSSSSPLDSTRYLSSTSGDGSVSFWRYIYNEHGVAEFEEQPTRYNEKIRPGQAQMICASFSPGGVFFVVGSADHHVRVYQMNCPGGPQRILEDEAHDDRVDSIQWCNQPDLRFLSGSKDGTARIWKYVKKQWTSVVLNMKTGDNSERKPDASAAANVQPATTQLSSTRQVQSSGPAADAAGSAAAAAAASGGGGGGVGGAANETSQFRVTMVNWSSNDAVVITAVSDFTLKVWDSQTVKLVSTLRGHEDEIYVLEPHPINPDLLLSAAHDGYIMLWDLRTSACLFKHRNMVEGSGHAAVFDAKWTPDGLAVAASDSHGHLLFLGHGDPQPYDRLPAELFFHTDYRPLLRDSFHNVLDEQTQVPPHLLPPPFLVNSEGNPYPPSVQRLAVRGREKMSDQEALIPGNQVLVAAAAAAAAAAGGEPPADVPLPVILPPPPPAPQPQPHQVADNEQSNDSNMSGSSEAPDGGAAAGRSEDTDHSGPEHRLDRNGDQNGQPSTSAAARYNSSRNSTAASREILLKAASHAAEIESQLLRNRAHSLFEATLFGVEHSKGGFEHDYARPSKGARKKAANTSARRVRATPATASSRRPAPPQPASASSRRYRQVADEDGEDGEEGEGGAANGDEDSMTSDCSLDESDFSSGETTTEDDSGHSDWGSDDQDEKHDSGAGAAQTPSPPKKRSTKSKRKAAHKAMEKIPRPAAGEITEEYMPSPWLSESMPKKAPYFPQIGDVLMYFKQGHRRYTDLVEHRKVYQIHKSDMEWTKKRNLGDATLVRVVNVYFVIRPPRLCVLDFCVLDSNTMRETGDSFSIKYHDMNDVVDFLVLHQVYGSSKDMRRLAGDRIRCQIDDCWWKGTVAKVEGDGDGDKNPFLSILCDWDDGENEPLSPWDVEALTAETEDIADGTPATAEQIKEALYQPTAEEWNGLDRDSESARILESLSAIMDLAIAEPFNYPVDLTAYPEYMIDVEYPMDFNLIKSRVDNLFYRRIAALVYDLKLIALNAASFNKPRSDIVKNAKILTKISQEIVYDPNKTKDDVSRLYHSQVESFEWSSSDDDDDGMTTLSPKKKKQDSPTNLNPKKWKHDCNELLGEMCNNPLSVPFREPVSEINFPDYHRFVATPMDLSTVRESLHIGEYGSPLDFEKDVRLIFKNSKTYNTTPTSKVLSMTIKLEDWFDEKIADVITDWRRTNRRLTMAKIKHKNKKAADQQQIHQKKGKGKGKGKGQSNRIKRKKRKRNSDEDEDLEDEQSSEEDEEDEEEEDDEDEDESTTPEKSGRASKSRSGRLLKPGRIADHDSSELDESSSERRRRSSRPPRQQQQQQPVKSRFGREIKQRVIDSSDGGEEDEARPPQASKSRSSRQPAGKSKGDSGESSAPAITDCGKCKYCLDMPKFNGPGRLRQKCVEKRAAAVGSASVVVGRMVQTSSSAAVGARSASEADRLAPADQVNRAASTSADSLSGSQLRRASSRQPKPALRFRSDSEGDHSYAAAAAQPGPAAHAANDSFSPPSRERSQRASRPVSFKEASEDDDGSDAAAAEPAADAAASAAAAVRPVRSRKPVTKSPYKYSDMSDEDEKVPIARRRSQARADSTPPRPSPKKKAGVKRKLESSSDDDDDDEQPLAKKKSVVGARGKSAAAAVSRNEDPNEDGDSQTRASSSEPPQLPKRRRPESMKEASDSSDAYEASSRSSPRKRRAAAMKKAPQLDEDSSEDSPAAAATKRRQQPLGGKRPARASRNSPAKPPAVPPTRNKKKQSEESVSFSEEEDDDDEDDESESESASSAEESDIDEEFIDDAASPEPRRRRGGRQRPQRNAALKKRLRGGGGGGDGDGGSDDLAPPTSRLSNRNTAAASATKTRSLKKRPNYDERSSGGGGGGGGGGGASDEENRRPLRRRRGAAKRARAAQSPPPPSESDSDDDWEERAGAGADGRNDAALSPTTVSSRGRVRKPNPRII